MSAAWPEQGESMGKRERWTGATCAVRVTGYMNCPREAGIEQVKCLLLAHELWEDLRVAKRGEHIFIPAGTHL